METEIKNSPIKGLNIKTYYAFSLIYKLIAVLVPILVTPYLARVLEPDGNGVISFVSSIASYFILLANLGIEDYGQRTAVIYRNDKEFLNKFVVEIFILKLCLSLLSGTLFIIIVSIVGGANLFFHCQCFLWCLTFLGCFRGWKISVFLLLRI